MPDLPSPGTVTQAQQDRILAAFPGATNAEKLVEYKALLQRTLRGYVLQKEAEKIDVDNNKAKQEALDAAEAALPFTPAVRQGRP